MVHIPIKTLQITYQSPYFTCFFTCFPYHLTSPFSPSPPACPASHDPHAVEVAVRLQDIPCRLQAVLVALHLRSDGFAGENHHLLTQQKPPGGMWGMVSERWSLYLSKTSVLGWTWINTVFFICQKRQGWWLLRIFTIFSGIGPEDSKTCRSWMAARLSFWRCWSSCLSFLYIQSITLLGGMVMMKF